MCFIELLERPSYSARAKYFKKETHSTLLHLSPTDSYCCIIKRHSKCYTIQLLLQFSQLFSKTKKEISSCYYKVQIGFNGYVIHLDKATLI